MSQGTSSETSQQFKCEFCGRIFNNQNELDDHYKSAHTGQVASQSQSARGMSSTSSSSEALWSGEATEHQNYTETQKDTSTTEGEGSSRTWKEATKDELKSMEQTKIEAAPDTSGSDREMTSAYREQSERVGETAVREEEKIRQPAQTQFKCPHCGQVFASQNDLNKHLKNIHDVETESDMGKRGQPQESVAT